MQRRGRSAGFTLVELLIVIAIVGVLSTMAMVGYQHARTRSQEAAAVVALTNINQAQFAYMQSCGKHRYAPTLASLGKAVPGQDHGFISPDLSVSDPLEKSGYIFTMSGTPSIAGDQTCHGDAPLDTYRLTADPVREGEAARFFGTNTDRVVYGDAVTFAKDMPESGSPGHGVEIK